MPYIPDYFTGAPASHRNNHEICCLEDERDALWDEYNALTADDVEWTEAGEARCLFLEERLAELEREIESLTYDEE